ncbi:hypothetical protein PPSIR1_18947 [Plesiocystis pacifica SIR-1]|uniref:Uncharacterized protein n=1 Tax=Plesiocystis pacifica SIR-1 TaxID=391625 RepID=A6GGK6_9BACT|nr:hypothetical protein [Plesiocystis pacifica]EDM74966.1 hypothetical protein PPSIR1_18947 [Plesiocystis pacifica SIR-1]
MEVNEGTAPAGGSGPASDTERGVRLRFVEILGLYRPGFSDRQQRGDRRPIRCGYQPGYTSADNRGRIFVNHRPRANGGENWQRVRAKDTQYIDVTVEVSDPAQSLPSNAKIRWLVSARGDASLSRMHTDAADYIRQHASRGQCDYPRPNGARRPVFEALPNYPGTVVNNQRGMETAIVNGRSRVRMHCTNNGGDAYRLFAGVVVGSTPGPQIHTGDMTMWKRVDVEYRRMRGVTGIQVGRVANAFELAFIQLDFTASIRIPYRRALTATDDIEGAGASFCAANFTHARRPGWFLLIAANMATSLRTTNPQRYVYPDLPASNTSTPPPLPATMASVRTVVLPVVLPAGADASAVYLVDGNRDLVFYAAGTTRFPSSNCTYIAVHPLRYHPDPQPGSSTTTGTLSFAMARPRDYVPQGSLSAQGLGFGQQVLCRVRTGRAIGAAGVTPVYPHNNQHYFAGRSLVFMGNFSNADQAVQTAIHELCHAFGFPHSCGRRQAVAGARHSCPMAILNYWAYGDGTDTLVRWRNLPRGFEFCERHLLALREIHLEDNDYLWRWP